MVGHSLHWMAKLPSNASKQCSGTISDLRRKKEKIENKVAHLLEEQVEVDKADEDSGEKEAFPDKSHREKKIEKLHKKAAHIEK